MIISPCVANVANSFGCILELSVKGGFSYAGIVQIDCSKSAVIAFKKEGECTLLHRMERKWIL